MRPRKIPYDVEHQAAARCLSYPDARLRTDLPLLRRALEGRRGAPARLLRAFLDHAEASGQQDLEEHYVRVFDFKNRRCLHLSWWTDGDTRRRGESLVAFKETYRAHGLDFHDTEELPDFLPAVLEFSALARTDELLRRNRPGLELLRLSLAEAETPYAGLLEAVCGTLPGASPKDREAARAMARGGPPQETVGLEPYGAPDAPGSSSRLLPILTGEQ
ncbi:nitrate reductase molybdenum cofactor assembly chaperone [Streptomyces sp. ODS28]|uniref:nitrate reductase molybdenum cofactor assembly chaperone n=1 Tax=Streptomyces sp. ODS28 TaxID=3136688 RepID=UPI0031E991AA